RRPIGWRCLVASRRAGPGSRVADPDRLFADSGRDGFAESGRAHQYRDRGLDSRGGRAMRAIAPVLSMLALGQAPVAAQQPVPVAEAQSVLIPLIESYGVSGMEA